MISEAREAEFAGIQHKMMQAASGHHDFIQRDCIEVE
jgi:hypothetical protein